MKVAKEDFYKLIAPRPTVCVSTLSPSGNFNLAPYSFVTPLSMNPPLIGVAVGKGKDTIQNARELGDFVLSPLTRVWKDKGVQSEVSLPRDESEFEKVNLTPVDSEEVQAPSIKEAPINKECRYFDDFELADHFILVGEVISISAKEDALKNGRINLEKLGAVGHISGEEFCIAVESTKIERE